MSAELLTHAAEEGTFIITASFTDASGAAVIPSSIKWTLSDLDGNIINLHEDEVVSPPAASVDILLEGDDLALQIGETMIACRVFTIKAVYDSDEGSDLPLNTEVRFYIDALLNVPTAE